MPNIFELANISRRKGVIITRLERIKREGSPNYPYSLPVTAAGVVVHLTINLLFPASRKYQPLDYVEIVNNSIANPILFTVNNADAWLIPAGTIRTIHGKGIALQLIDITNQGAGATVAGELEFTFKKEAMTIDKWSQEQ